MVARAGRSRLLICLGLLLLMVGFLTVFHNSQQQLDELRQLGLRCEQQQKSVQAQMEVVVDQKLRLENSLASERMINEANRKELKQRAKEEKEEHSKTSMEANIRYASLQQQCNLVKSQLGDLTEECSNSKKRQSEEINSLRLKVSELQGKVHRYQHESANDVEHLKAQLEQLKNDKINLEATLRQQLSYKDQIIEKLRDLATKMEKENTHYFERCKLSADQLPKQHHRYRDVLEALSARMAAPAHSFNEQRPIIPKPLPAVAADSANVLQEPRLMKTSTSVPGGAGQRSSSDRNLQLPILAAPTVLQAAEHSSKRSGGPPAGGGGTMAVVARGTNNSTSTTTTVASRAGAAPNRSATRGSGSVVRKPLANRHTKPVPEGIVPFPEMMPELDENRSENVLDNRYANVAAAVAAPATGGGGTGKKKGKSDARHGPSDGRHGDLNFMNGAGGNPEADNGAHEEHDNEGGVRREEGDAPDGAAADRMAPGAANDEAGNENVNAAEEDTNLYDNGNNNGIKAPFGGNPLLDQQLEYNDVIPGAAAHRGRPKHVGGAGADQSKAAIIDRMGDKLINEIAHDHGKEGDNYPNEMEDLHLVGNEAEEEDVSDYDDPTALKQGHAERH
ncbi:uncharacterized protein LOC128272232 isoform X3 [Anopheles cruzii]|uniref:uncharacterized protein LOC128272232 isoform X3 n=1 Tax=Anopheles cruzii TaxID=68878 RepID=UPI0022EC4359|nr:uncharacterized protein LOC128272232 isoform X3 [Anopheles cruzii]